MSPGWQQSEGSRPWDDFDRENMVVVVNTALPLGSVSTEGASSRLAPARSHDRGQLFDRAKVGIYRPRSKILPPGSHGNEQSGISP
jgi:hypothetical protein